MPAKDSSRQTYDINVTWEGPFTGYEVVKRNKDAGKAPDYDGEDYGLYQIYGRHILGGNDTLLYIGQAVKQTFSERISQHQKWWLREESDVKIYLGRIFHPERHSKKDDWRSWEKDVDVAEKILIYKYSPNYNSDGVAEKPLLTESYRLRHSGHRHRLHAEDIVEDL